jgi:hypothetical protein
VPSAGKALTPDTYSASQRLCDKVQSAPADRQEVQPRAKPKAAQSSFIRSGLSVATRRPR